VRFGASITVEENGKQLKFQIVGSDEADIRNGLLPVTSPLAIALIGKAENDVVEVTSPGGIKLYEILSIEYI
jgi:transcription elongation factor GreA